MFSEILNLIQKYDTIIIPRHKKPDGDALGSQIGLKHILLENFPGKQVYMVGDDAGHYSFMDDSVMDEIPDSYYADALAIVLDTSARKLISDDRYTLAKDTRTGYEMGNIQAVMDGDIDGFINAYLSMKANGELK